MSDKLRLEVLPHDGRPYAVFFGEVWIRVAVTPYEKGLEFVRGIRSMDWAPVGVDMDSQEGRLFLIIKESDLYAWRRLVR